jgi:hypothetical protein
MQAMCGDATLSFRARPGRQKRRGNEKKKHAQTLFFFFFFSMRLSAPSIARRLTTSHTMASPPAYEALTAKLCQASALDVREK